MNLRKVIQFAALGLILIVLPIGSVVYLMKGYTERKDALDQLKYDLPLPSFQATAQNGKTINKTDLKGGFAVLGKVDKFSVSDPVIQSSEGLFKEFSSSLKMTMITYVNNYDSTAIVDYVESIREDTISTWYFIQGNPNFDEIFEEHGTSHLALIDTFGTVRNFYNTADKKEIDVMAKHVAMFVLPLMKQRGDLVYKREDEI